MDYTKYDQLQADLGAVADEFRLNIRSVLLKSNANKETKELVEDVCASTYNSFKQLEILVSEVARLTVK